MIYHITSIANWEAALVQGWYACESLEKEGFLHTSNKHQLRGVIDRYYKDQKKLVLLHIDERKVDAEIKHELSPAINDIFPHIYGRLNLNAIVETSDL